jgi:hypothetical protein
VYFSIHNRKESEVLELGKDFGPVKLFRGHQNKLDVSVFVFFEERHQVVQLCMEVVSVFFWGEDELGYTPAVLL